MRWPFVKRKDFEEVVYKLECLLCHVTGGKLSKYTYSLKTMESAATDYMNDWADEILREEQEGGVIALTRPVKIGDKIYHVLLDESIGSWFISEDTVTDVSIKGVWVSGFDPPQDDEGWLTRWEKFGKNDDGAIPCFTREEAESFLEEMNHEIGFDKHPTEMV